MAWIKSEQGLATHPKLFRLMRHLKVTDKVKMVGHLHFLWWWVLTYAPDGNAASFDDSEIAIGAAWDGNPAEFVRALRECRLMDSDGMIHDWMKYSGQLIKAREENAEKQRQFREKKKLELAVLEAALGKTHKTTNGPHLPEAGGPVWDEFWAYCQRINLPSEKYARDKWLLAEQDHWKGKGAWQKYAERVKGWYQQDVATGKVSTAPAVASAGFDGVIPLRNGIRIGKTELAERGEWTAAMQKQLEDEQVKWNEQERLKTQRL